MHVNLGSKSAPQPRIRENSLLIPCYQGILSPETGSHELPPPPRTPCELAALRAIGNSSLSPPLRRGSLGQRASPAQKTARLAPLCPPVSADRNALPRGDRRPAPAQRDASNAPGGRPS